MSICIELFETVVQAWPTNISPLLVLIFISRKIFHTNFLNVLTSSLMFLDKFNKVSLAPFLNVWIFHTEIIQGYAYDS
jgi:hypothetical protein